MSDSPSPTLHTLPLFGKPWVLNCIFLMLNLLLNSLALSKTFLEVLSCLLNKTALIIKQVPLSHRLRSFRGTRFSKGYSVKLMHTSTLFSMSIITSLVYNCKNVVKTVQCGLFDISSGLAMVL